MESHKIVFTNTKTKRHALLIYASSSIRGLAFFLSYHLFQHFKKLRNSLSHRLIKDTEFNIIIFVNDLVSRTLNIAGSSDTTFSPDMTCSRAQVVTFLWRVAG